jgi:hypothetical protein
VHMWTVGPANYSKITCLVAIQVLHAVNTEFFHCEGQDPLLLLCHVRM